MDELEAARAARDAALERIEHTASVYPALIQALREIQSQCSGHSDEFSRNVYAIASAALKKDRG